ncbi:hypothetical protein KUTeg_008519 [Tegillarca granosa]|uniref:TOCA HR1 domain-containing protein n=1 Tax=Tegillarca granosa TaxID=220873 RepID=A0ABQ9F9D6_TEGGR|nr:hypothetical protein KUTeg_008519 [Tegillarca granosa]
MDVGFREIFRGCSQLQALEEERIAKMSEYLNHYNSHVSMLGPKLTQAEDMQFTMKSDRRKSALQNYLLYLRQAIEREKKGKEGVEKLVEVYEQRPNFADKDAQDDARQRLAQVTFTMNFLEASHFKMASVLAKLEGQPKMTHKFSPYVEHTHDEFDDFDDCNDCHENQMLGRCRVLYDYTAMHNDELSIKNVEYIFVYEILLRLPLSVHNFKLSKCRRMTLFIKYFKCFINLNDIKFSKLL